ncbi:M4 family metallopeptidase [Longispora albida]|uniref:M4 family metallopeptidase n=1 Tax=Longispora albida TaxID=203523 RepID=UPI0003AA4756|nr:M4 family metallopeptidase [Longispora albida]
MRRTTAALSTVVLSAALVPLLNASPVLAASDRVPNALGLLKSHAGEARADADQTFLVKNTVVDPDGASHVRMHRYYRGLPVVGGDFVLHQDRRGGWRGISQTLSHTPKLSTQPGIAIEAAEARAVSESTASGRQADGTQLVVFAPDGTSKLAYEVVVGGVHADQTPSELHVIVDANSGSVLDSWEGIAAGTGHGYHVGTVPVGSTAAGGTFELRDGARGGGYTTNLNGATNGNGSIYTSASDVFGDGSTTHPAAVGVDAHYGVAMTWDYYKNVHGRNGIRNDGVGAYSRVHYGSKYINAFWSDQCFCMTYGDGDLAQGWHPLTSIDVAGHEMSHGVTSNSAGLVYRGEPGGLNEATSDIFGTLVEFYANNPNDAPDYLIGEMLRTNGTSLRYMDQPSRDGRSADCWYNKVGRLDVHLSSGVANHFFYLLAVGSGSSQWGNSPTCDGSSVSGIGNDKAGKIWYRALTVHMTSRTDYKGARVATLNAATDLYGAGSAEYNAVAAAWSAVSVN